MFMSSPEKFGCPCNANTCWGLSPGYRLHYLDMTPPADPLAEPDAGGCYLKCSSQDDANAPWTQDVGETEVLLKITWTTCQECKYHMGDEQWEKVEVAMNKATQESDDTYQKPEPKKAGVPDIGKYLMCGVCEGEFYSESGLSAKCTACR